IGTYISKGKVFHGQPFTNFDFSDILLFPVFLFFFVMNLVQPLQADTRILIGLDKTDHLSDGAVQLADDVLERKHHTQGNIAFYHKHSRGKRDKNILELIDHGRAHALGLLKRKSLNGDIEQACLYKFPLPSFLLFRIVHFDLLHAVDQFDHRALFLAQLGKAFVIKFPPAFHKIQDPQDIDNAPSQKYQKYRKAIINEYRPEYKKIKKRKQGTEGGSGQQVFYPAVVPDALHDVPCHPGVKVGNGQVHQLDKEIRYQGDIDPGAEME